MIKCTSLSGTPKMKCSKIKRFQSVSMEPITGGNKSAGMKRTEAGLPASWQGAVRTSKLGTRL